MASTQQTPRRTNHQYLHLRSKKKGMELQFQDNRDATLLEEVASAPNADFPRDMGGDGGRLRRGDHELQEERPRTQR